MSGTPTPFDAFMERWRAQLDEAAETRFEAQLSDDDALLYSPRINRFVQSLGLKSIGLNWELLDAEADLSEPRSARAAFVEALSRNMVFSQIEWLGDAGALACCEDFLACFDAERVQVVTNRMYFGWNPISEATFEWAFVGFDGSRIALLLLMAED